MKPSRLRHFWFALLFAPVLVVASSLDALTSSDAAGGLRAALSKGIDAAVTQLGARNGFLLDPKAMIPLPPTLQKADKVLRMVGMGDQADELKTAMNHAAEDAVHEAAPVFKSALKKMTLADAKDILTGGDDAGTQYFRQATSTELAAKFKPIVARATAKAKLGALYDRYAGKAAEYGLLKSEDADLDEYVTRKALDGLFGRIAEQEQAIRKDPLGQSSALIRKVFGAVQ